MGLVERSKGEESQFFDGFTVTVNSGRTLSHSGNMLSSVDGLECDGEACDDPPLSRRGPACLCLGWEGLR